MSSSIVSTRKYVDTILTVPALRSRRDHRTVTDKRREVVITLLNKNADPNRRYPDFNGNRALWSPTLFAAQLGDLDVLKAMIEAGGNPWLSLDQSSPRDEKNALWVAVSYKRHSVIQYLLTLLPERATN